MSQLNDLSFLPDDYVATRARARANRLCGSLLLITIFSVAGAFTYAQSSLRELRAEYLAVNQQYQQEADRLKRLDALKKQQAELARRAKLAEALIERAPRTDVLHEAKSALPAGASLVEVLLNSRVRTVVKTPEQILAEKQSKRSRGKKDETAANAPQPKAYDVTLKIVGMAYTDVQVADYISKLGQSSNFEDVNLLVSREITYEEQPVRHFEVEMRVRDEPADADTAEASIASTEVLSAH